jgi:hypothetical protein
MTTVFHKFDPANPAHWLIVIVLGFAAMLELFVFLIVAYDLYALRQTPPWRTVSGDFLRMGNHCPPIAIYMTAMLVGPWFVLVGHLFLGQSQGK